MYPEAQLTYGPADTFGSSRGRLTEVDFEMELAGIVDTRKENKRNSKMSYMSMLIFIEVSRPSGYEHRIQVLVWVRVPVVTLEQDTYYNCFSSPRGING